ncbi:unnamed protein product [Arabis nemorensis]|uniref:Uncharacterized protein n=1 Tax=Arabis nemorensis TaxID=586526 RepID=A0A565CFM6_9BRAS|nr:unnamed protein product [Arabis nemorensis]
MEPRREERAAERGDERLRVEASGGGVSRPADSRNTGGGAKRVDGGGARRDAKIAEKRRGRKCFA